MLSDIWAIMLKEWKEILVRRGQARTAILTMLIVPIGVLGVYLPLQIGPAWVGTPAFLAAGLWLPQLLSLGIVADSFAGERERHTLETLLATRLSDLSILIGKIAAIVVYACGLSLTSAATGLAALNLRYRLPHWILPEPKSVLALTAFALLSSGFAAGVGVLISLRAATVRQAQQTLSMITLAITFGLLIGIGSLPESWKRAIADWTASPDHGKQALALGMILAFINLALFAAARARFRRNRLILD